VLPLDPVSSQAPIPQQSHSLPVSSAIPVLPASSSSLLVKSSKGSTISENEFETPEAAIQARLEEEFIKQFTVFEPQETPEQCLIKGIRLQIQSNRHFWPILETCYGNLGVIPGTDAIVRDFYYTHYLAHEWLQIAAIPQLRSLHSECNLLDEGLAQCQYLDPEAAAAHNDHYSQFTYDNSESEFGAPEEQDFTIHSPHPSAGLTPVLVPETLSAQGGETHCKAQLCGQHLPAKKGKVQAKLTQTVQIQDWDSLTHKQQQETLNWGIDLDISSDSDKGMATATFTQVQSGSGVTRSGSGSGAPGGGGGGPPGGRGGGGGGTPPGRGGHGPPAVPPTLDKLNRLMADLGNIIGILAQQVVDLTCDRARGCGGGAKDLVSKPKPWDGQGGSAEARHFLTAFHNYAASQGTPLNTYDPTANTWTTNEE
jgi:hypothetical protein